MDEITELEYKFTSNMGKIEQLTSENSDLIKKFNKLRFDIEKGTIVKSTKSGKIYRAEIIERCCWRDLGKPWVIGNPQRKDGTYGLIRINLFDDWEVIK